MKSSVRGIKKTCQLSFRKSTPVTRLCPKPRFSPAFPSSHTRNFHIPPNTIQIHASAPSQLQRRLQSQQQSQQQIQPQSQLQSRPQKGFTAINRSSQKEFHKVT